MLAYVEKQIYSNILKNTAQIVDDTLPYLLGACTYIFDFSRIHIF